MQGKRLKSRKKHAFKDERDVLIRQRTDKC